MTQPLVLIAYRCSTEGRARAHEFTRRWWREGGLRIVEAEGPRVGPFNVSAAFNEAARLAGPWSVALFTGTETFVDIPAVLAAFKRAEATGHLVHAARKWGRLSPEATAAIYDGAEPTAALLDALRPRPLRGLKVVPRALFEAVHGFDEGFVGYHGEDLAFNRACKVLGGEEWIPGVALSLYDGEHRARDEIALRARNDARLRRYYSADTRRKMRALLESFRPPSEEGDVMRPSEVAEGDRRNA